MTTMTRAKVSFLAAILIYGTLGVFVRLVALPSSLIALARSGIGTLFLLLLMAIKRQPPGFAAIRRNWKPLLLAGALLGFNWVAMFEAYRYTTVAVATLCTYMNPVIIVTGAAIFLHERLTLRKIVCVLVALVGMVFVSGVTASGLPTGSSATGILLGLLTAVLYGIIVLSNKTLRDISAYDRTAAQLLIATFVLLPYYLLTEDLPALTISAQQIGLLLVLGIVHTGFAYSLYFGSMQTLPAQTLAILSYLDPVTAVLLSALVLHEPLHSYEIIGAVCILGAAIVSELPAQRRS